MGKNKKEHFIFILMICTSMVFIMSCYNIALIKGFSLEIFKYAVLGFLPAFIFALIGDIFVVGKIVKIIASKILTPTDSMMKKGMVMSFFTGCGMVLWMSFYGTVTNVGFGPHFLAAYGMGIVKNFVFAIPLNLLIVSPLIRFVFFKMFPPVLDENLNINNLKNEIV
ncbi:MAG: DUF2798 domain-containing protein [Peptostreptococcaceae bacterium]